MSAITSVGRQTLLQRIILGVSCFCAAMLTVHVPHARAELQQALIIPHDGVDRRYDLYVPDSAPAGLLPLVLDLHGATVGRVHQRINSGFLELAMREGFYVAWPQARGTIWNAFLDNQPPSIGLTDDVSFLLALLDEIVANHPVDSRRIYVSGLSQGGLMTYRLLCDAADTFAAASAMAAPFVQETTGLCNPSREVPLLAVHGINDPIVLYDGGPVGGTGGLPEKVSLGAADQFQFWRQKSTCTGPVNRQNLGPDSFCDTDSNCAGDTEIASCTVFGTGDLDGHIIYDNSDNIDLAQLSWDFFSQFAPADTPFAINAGLNDAWYDPATLGQGFFITVFEDLGKIFLAWFTYDTERPGNQVMANLGEPGHRWLTAFGPYSGGSAVLDLELTQGGIFNAAQPMVTQSLDGTIMLEFSDCSSGMVSYDITSIDMQGEIPIQRIADANVPACEALR